MFTGQVIPCVSVQYNHSQSAKTNKLLYLFYILFYCVSSRYLHQDVEGAGAGAVRAGEEIVEVDTVSVILLHDWQLKPGLLPSIILWDVHIHVGTWTQKQRQGEGQKRNITYNSRWIVFTVFLNQTRESAHFCLQLFVLVPHIPSVIHCLNRRAVVASEEVVSVYNWNC